MVVTVDVRLLLFDIDAVGLSLRVGDAVAMAVIVLVAVVAPDALAPYDRLLVGVYDTCGQKHMGCQP